MSLPTVEIVYAPATEIVRNDPHGRDVVNTPFSVLKEQDGMIKIYYGLQHEDQKTCYHLVVWESFEHHQRLMNNAEVYPRLTGSVTSVFDTTNSPIQMIHVKPTTSPYKAFDAPVLEIATFTLLEGQSKPALEASIDELLKVIKDNAPGVVDAAWGPTVESDDVVVLFIGWTDVEGHLDFVRTNAKLKDIVGKGKDSLFSLNVVHVPLAAF